MSLICSIRWFEKALVPPVLSAKKKGINVLDPYRFLSFVEKSRRFKDLHPEILAFVREVGQGDWEETINDVLVLFEER